MNDSSLLDVSVQKLLTSFSDQSPLVTQTFSVTSGASDNELFFTLVDPYVAFVLANLHKLALLKRLHLLYVDFFSRFDGEALSSLLCKELLPSHYLSRKADELKQKLDVDTVGFCLLRYFVRRKLDPDFVLKPDLSAACALAGTLAFDGESQSPLPSPEFLIYRTFTALLYAAAGDVKVQKQLRCCGMPTRKLDRLASSKVPHR